jgi:hypothetical protein
VSWILPDPEILKSLKVLETRTIIKMAINDPRPKLGLDKDPEKRRAYLREWYGKNRERVKATQKAYELRNKEKIKAESWHGKKHKRKRRMMAMLRDIKPTPIEQVRRLLKEWVLYRRRWKPDNGYPKQGLLD